MENNQYESDHFIVDYNLMILHMYNLMLENEVEKFLLNIFQFDF